MEKQNSNIPNSAFDVEYATQWKDEVDFLASRGIYYTIRKPNDYGILTYKYTRTVDLWVALADFYLKRKRNVKSQATFKGFAPERAKQLSFVDANGKLDESYVNKINNAVSENVSKSINAETPVVNHNVIDLDKLKEAKKLLADAADQIGKEKLELLTRDTPKTEDDTE